MIRRVDRDTDELVGLARSLLTRELTTDECRRYLGSECPIVDRGRDVSTIGASGSGALSVAGHRARLAGSRG